MKRKNQFDEVMIVNPSQGTTNSDQRVRLMRFHNTIPPELSGYYAEPEPYGYYAEPEPYGYYAEPEPYGYYGEVDPTMAYYGQVDPTYGYYGEVDPTMGYYGQVDPTYGYYGEVDPTMAYYGQVDPATVITGSDPDGYYGQVDPATYTNAAPEFAAWRRDGTATANLRPPGSWLFCRGQPMGDPARTPIADGYYGQARRCGLR